MNISEEIKTYLEAPLAKYLKIFRGDEPNPFFTGKVSPRKPDGDINVILNDIIQGDLNHKEIFDCIDTVTTKLNNVDKTYRCDAVDEAGNMYDTQTIDVIARVDGIGALGDSFRPTENSGVENMPIVYVSSGLATINGKSIGLADQAPYQYKCDFKSSEAPYTIINNNTTRLIVKEADSRFRFALYYVNRFGGIDWILCNNASEKTTNVQNNTITRKLGNGTMQEVLNKDVDTKLRLKSGLYTAGEYNKLEDILLSSTYWLWDSEKPQDIPKEVILTTNTFTTKNSISDKLTQFIAEIQLKETLRLW